MIRQLAVVLALLMVLSPLATHSVLADSDHVDVDSADSVDDDSVDHVDVDSADRVDDDKDDDSADNRGPSNKDRYERRERFKDGKLEVREKVRERVSTPDGVKEFRAEVRKRLPPEKQDLVDRMSPAAIAALEANGNLDHVLSRAKLARASEVRLEKRVVSDEVRERVRERLKNARERFKERKELFKEKRESFKEKKQLLQQCDENCDDVRQQVHSEAQQTVLVLLDSIQNHLEEIRAEVEGSDVLTDDEVSEKLEALDEWLSEVDELRSAVEQASNSDELRKVASDVKDLLSDIKKEVARDHALVNGKRVLKALKKAEKFDARLECTIEKGADVDPSEFRVLLASARDHVNSARDLFSQHDLSGARSELRLAAGDLKDAAPIARDLLRDVKSQGFELEDCEVVIDDSEDFDDSQPTDVADDSSTEVNA